MPTYQATIDELDGVLVSIDYALKVGGTPRAWAATTPFEADLVQSAPAGGSPGVDSVVSVSATQIRVNFSNPAVDNAALRSAGSYKITPPLSIHSVTPELVSEPTYVILAIDEQKTGQTYDLELLRIEKAP